MSRHFDDLETRDPELRQRENRKFKWLFGLDRTVSQRVRVVNHTNSP